MTLDDLDALDRTGFVAALGGVFEHSPWVAERAWAARPFADLDALHRAMVATVDGATTDDKLALIGAHPDLAGKAARAGDLTRHSTREQAGAGLDRLSKAEYARFHALNDAYRARFEFPFIIAVKEHDKAGILAAFERRLGHERDAEIAEALANVALIAKYRLMDMIGS